jgi:hypothetical protein
MDRSALHEPSYRHHAKVERMVHMRDFSWKYFSMTGDVDAYLLYKKVSEEDQGETDPLSDEQAFEDPLDELNG